MFGGFLLLGGRAADLLGRRAVFLVGVGLFTAASLACGLASSEGFLIVARGVQGVGGAIIAPAALSIVSTAFPEGAERNKALGVWGALGGSGAAIGVIVGGILTKYAGWEWIFFVNIPIGVLVIALTPAFVRESRIEVERRRYDPLGAVTISASIILLVYSISKAPDVGWGAARTIVLLVAGGRAPRRVPADREPDLGAADAALDLEVAHGDRRQRRRRRGRRVMFSTFFLLTLYAQQVLHYSALQTGLAMLATALTAIASAGAAEALVTRLGPKYVLTAGVAFMGGGLVYFAQLPVNGSYLRDLFGPLVLIGLGTGFSFVPISIIALAGVPERQAGLASGLMNTTQQVGGAVGVAVVATIFATRVAHEVPRLVSEGVAPELAGPRAMVSGFTLGYWVLAGVAFVGCVAATLILRRVHLGEPEAQPVETHVVSPFCLNRSATSALTTAVFGDQTPEQSVVPSA